MKFIATTTTDLGRGIPRKARGAVLFVALVFLVLITLLGLTAAGTSILQERMTGGMRNSQLGLMGAESSARQGESWLWNLSNNNGKINCGYNGGSTGFCYQAQTGGTASAPALLRNPLVDQFRSAPTWLPFVGVGPTGGMAQYTALTAGASNTALLSRQPEFIFEDLGELLPPNTVHNGQAGAIGRDPFGCKDAGCQSMHSYRITSRSTGGNDASVRAVEVYFGAVAPSN